MKRTQGGASLCPGLSPCAPLGQKTIESRTMNQNHSGPHPPGLPGPRAKDRAACIAAPAPPACGRGGVAESMQTRFSPNRRKGSIRATKSRNHSRPAVTPGQSSVRNGVNGNPLALNMLQTGLSAQAYRTETGLGTLGLETRILFPSTIFATAG